jgi:hypothetical protein
MIYDEFGIKPGYEILYENMVRTAKRFGFHAGHSFYFNLKRNKKI